MIVCLQRSQREFTVSKGEESLTARQLKRIIRETRGYSEEKQTLWRGGNTLADEEAVDEGTGLKLILTLEKYPVSITFQEKTALSIQVSADMTGLELLHLSLSAYQIPCSGGHLQYTTEYRSLADDEEIGEISPENPLRLYPAARVRLCSPLGTVIRESYLCTCKPIQNLVSTTAERLRLHPNIRIRTESGIFIQGRESLEDIGIIRDLRLFLLYPTPNRSK